MKRSIMAALILAVSFSCDKVEQLLSFSINNEVAFRIPASTVIELPLDVPTPNVTTNSNETFENNETTASLVKDIRLREMKLTITAPAGRNFNFLKSIHIYISSSDQNNEMLLASLEEVPSNVNSITLDPADEKLDQYVKAPDFKLRTSIVTDEALTQNVDIKANLKFKVIAAPL